MIPFGNISYAGFVPRVGEKSIFGGLMPYINRTDRAKYQKVLAELASLVPSDPKERAGNMNYVISLLIHKVYGGSMRYADHNEVLGVLSGVSQEFYRRFTAPYEDKKIKEQGDLTEL